MILGRIRIAGFTLVLCGGLVWISGWMWGLALGGNEHERVLSPAFNVGYRVVDFKCREGGEEKEKVLTVAVWYPTAAQPKSHQYGGPTSGKVALDAAPLAARGPYPMLVFSHGYGGGGIGSVFFTEALAAHGWVVAAPDHHDRHSAVRIRSGQLESFDREGFWRYAQQIVTSGPEDRQKYEYRLDEIRCAIDGMIASENFGRVIDINRIALGGHSFGGYTALGLSGTVRERYDSRIRAVLLFSTGAGGYLFREEELKGVRIPSMLMMGERERDQLRGAKTMLELEEKIYRAVSPPKYLLEIRGGNHFSFNNGFTAAPAARFLSGTEEQFQVIREYAIAFLEKHVAGKQDLDGVLDQGHAMLTRYLKEQVPDVAR